MDIYYENLVWILDALLLVFILILGLVGLLQSMVAKTTGHRRGIRQANVKAILQGLEGKDAKTIRQVLATVGDQMTADQWISMVNRYETIVPEETWPYLGEYLRSSTEAAEIERLAGEAKRKWLRIGAIKCVGRLRLPSALPILGKSLQANDEDIRYFAMISLGRIRQPASARILLELLKRGSTSGHKIVSLLELFPKDILPDVWKALENADDKARFWLLKLLSKFSVEGADKAFDRYLSDSSPDVRAAACECLGNSGTRASLEVLLQCLKDEVWYVRLQAVRALSRIDGKGCLPKLLEHTAQESSPLVQESVRDVMRRNLDDSLPAIERALDEKNHAVKMWHINALVDSNSVIKILAHTLSESDTERTRAVRIMEKLIRSGIHFGLKRTLDQFEQDSRNRILRIVAGIDAELATRIGSTPRRSFKYGHAYS